MLNIKKFFFSSLNLGVILLNVQHGFVCASTCSSHIKIMLFIRVIIQSLFVYLHLAEECDRKNAPLNDVLERDAIYHANPDSRSAAFFRSMEIFWPQTIINIYEFQHHNFHILICKLSS